MEFILFIIVIVVIIFFIKIRNLGSREAFPNQSEIRQASPYHYGRKRYLMTQAEDAFFKLLIESVGDRVNVFPQVRLSSLLYRAKGIEGRYWHAALARINQKSVDYVLCNKISGEILLVIELDDSTHDAASRIQRDRDVNEMLEEAGMPFMRFRDISHLTKDVLGAQIFESISVASHA